MEDGKEEETLEPDQITAEKSAEAGADEPAKTKDTAS
jgi:hypothetical protein